MDTSFNTILMERCFDNRMQMPSTSTSSGQIDSDEITANSIILNPSKLILIDRFDFYYKKKRKFGFYKNLLLL